MFSTMTLFIVAGSLTFSQLLAFSGASSGLSALVLGAEISPTQILIGLLVVTLLLGCFMDQVSMILLTVPLYMPIVTQLGFDPVWFGVLMLLVLEVSLATPPFGLLLFVMLGAAPGQVTMGEIVRSTLPFVAMTLCLVAVLVALPDLALWLPSLIRD